MSPTQERKRLTGYVRRLSAREGVTWRVTYYIQGMDVCSRAVLRRADGAERNVYRPRDGSWKKAESKRDLGRYKWHIHFGQTTKCSRADCPGRV
jgi:hypothetical protein